ncbi:MAG TPA: IS1595 family transposase [Bryobacteraceae bacterium]|jgi:transposase-like protein
MKRHGLSLIEVEDQFGTEKQCVDYVAAMRWPQGITCLKCGSPKVSQIVTNETEREITNRKGEVTVRRVPSRILFQCNADPQIIDGKKIRCRHQFSATTGTLFADTHLPLTTWFKAIAIILNAKKSVSALQMQRDLGVNYRTAWHLDHRIREAMQSEQGLFGGTVEVDATYHGGRFDPRRKRAAYDKQAVAGIMQRGANGEPSQVRAFPVEKEIAKVMTRVVRDNVAVDAKIMTDEHGAYMKLSKEGWEHAIVVHSKDEWVRGNVHTQSIEGFWSLFKRQVNGSHHWVSVKHLHRYLNECAFKFNNREFGQIFALIVLKLAITSPLRYKALTSSSEPSEPSASE